MCVGIGVATDITIGLKLCSINLVDDVGLLHGLYYKDGFGDSLRRKEHRNECWLYVGVYL